LKGNNNISTRLIIDVGNTLTKVAIFTSNQIIEQTSVKELTDHLILQIKIKHNPTCAIMSSVGKPDDNLLNLLKKHFEFFELTHNTPVPIRNNYATPETLGKDRLAAVVGAYNLFPGQNCLIIDAGTCITYDFLDSLGIYQGGAISPGINLRFKSLHTFTNRHPLVNHRNFTGLIGKSTEDSILSGVINGTMAEIEGIIEKYNNEYTNLVVVLTGGDRNYFDKKLKNSIFAVPNLVLKGLNEILDFNVKKQ